MSDLTSYHSSLHEEATHLSRLLQLGAWFWQKARPRKAQHFEELHHHVDELLQENTEDADRAAIHSARCHL